MPSREVLLLCQSGYEGYLAREIETLGFRATGRGPGWALAESIQLTEPAAGTNALTGAAFAHAVFDAPKSLSGATVNELAHGLVSWFLESLRDERVETPWPCLFEGQRDVVGLGRRLAAVEAAFHQLLKKKLGRLARLASAGRPRVGPARGLFVWFSDFGKAQASRSAYFTGPCRMADDDDAPSRSYLKVEESYGILGAEPKPGQTVCDLGAAPGGWSYSAAKRGARVDAVDNGPLKGGAFRNPLIHHRLADAFGFSPVENRAYDWLFSDLLEEPHKVLNLMVRPWLSGRWCCRFVINLKFGRVDPVALLAELRGPGSPFSTDAANVRIIHLYHDREEFTVMGSAAE